MEAARKTDDIFNSTDIEERGWKDFEDRLSMPIEIELLTDEEKQELINSGLINNASNHKTVVTF